MIEHSILIPLKDYKLIRTVLKKQKPPTDELALFQDINGHIYTSEIEDTIVTTSLEHDDTGWLLHWRLFRGKNDCPSEIYAYQIDAVVWEDVVAFFGIDPTYE